MSAIVILIFFSLALAGGFLAAFIWSVRNGQMDDAVTPAIRILYNDPAPTQASAPSAPTPTTIASTSPGTPAT